MKKTKKLLAILMGITMMFAMLTACGEKEESSNFDAEATAEEIVVKAAEAGMVGNWGLGNEYEVQALLTKYDQPTTYLSQASTVPTPHSPPRMSTSCARCSQRRWRSTTTTVCGWPSRVVPSRNNFV